MRGTKQITFPFEFQYSEGGSFKKEFAVTLRAPSLGQFKVHNQMTAYAWMAEIGIAARFADIKRPEPSAPDASEPQEPAAEETDQDKATRAMSVFAMGLGAEKYPEFVDFLKAKLTRNAALARVGDTSVALTDEVWESIEAEGGMDAVMLILGSFAGFFLRTADSATTSAKGNGSSLAPGSRSAAGVH